MTPGNNKPDVYKMHVSFENIYFIEAHEIEEARQKIRGFTFADLITNNNTTLLEIIPHDKVEELKDKIIIHRDTTHGTAGNED